MSTLHASPTTLVPPQNIEAEEAVLGAMLLSETAIGTVTELIDASHYYRNFEARIPFPTLHDLPGTYRAFDRIRALADAPDLILPGHDPLVLERLRRVADGIVEL